MCHVCLDARIVPQRLSVLLLGATGGSWTGLESSSPVFLQRALMMKVAKSPIWEAGVSRGHRGHFLLSGERGEEEGGEDRRKSYAE